MTYVIGAIIGLAFGGVVGIVKNHFLWGSYINRNENTAESGEAGALYGRMIGSNLINIATLLVAFLIRDILPFDGIAFLIGTAAALAIMNRFLSRGQKKQQNC